MSIIRTMRKQKAVYWAPLQNPRGHDQYTDDGRRKYDDPVEIRCRWENQRVEVLNENSEKVQVDATVYVDRDVAVGGKLRLGALSTLEFEGPPDENTEVYEIKRFEKMPNLRATEFLRKAFV